MRRRPLPRLLLAVLLLSGPALAQSEADKASARELGQSGQHALDASDWKQAEDRFRRADALFHAPTLSLGLARAQAHLGKVVEAWENYHRVLVENVTAPPAFAKALDYATAEIASVEGRRAHLTINVTGPEAPRVRINEVPVRAEALGVPRVVDPGHLVVAVTADGFKPASRAIDLGDGKDGLVVIAMERDAEAPVIAAVPVTPLTPLPAGSDVLAPSTARSGSVLKPLGIGVLVVGGAGLVLGAVTGGLALGKHGDLATECKSGCTTTASQSDLSTYHTLGALSTAGFVVGGVGVAAGITMLLLAPKSESKPATATVSPYLGFGTVGATGTF